MQYLITADLPEPLRTDLGQLRSELDIWTGRWLPPHVTIVRPFVLELEPAEIEEIYRPIQLTAQMVRWSLFRHPDANVVFLEPTQEPFFRIRNDLLSRVPRLTVGDRSVDPFAEFAEKPHFHVTIAAHLPDNTVDQIFSKVSQKTYMQVFQIGELSLFSMENGGFWEKIEP